MKIYKNFQITDEKDILPGTLGIIYIIDSARLYGMQEEKSILIEMVNPNSDKIRYRYNLIDKQVQEEFKKDMGVKDIEELVGKSVIGFVNKFRLGLAGIGIEDKVRENK